MQRSSFGAGVFFVSVSLVACSGAMSSPDAGAGGGAAAGGVSGAGGGVGTAGGSAGGAGGGAAGGCVLVVPGCPCGAGGGSIFIPDRLALATRAPGGDGGLITASSAGRSDSVLPMLKGTPVALTGFVIALKGDDTPAQQWSGNLDGPAGVACDAPRDLPLVTRAQGPAKLLAGELWYVRAPGVIAHASNDFQTLTSFASPGTALGAFAWDAPSDRLFAGALDANAVSVWRNARPRDGGVPDFELQAPGLRALEVLDGRLYVASGTSEVRVWGNLPALDQPRAHDFALTFDGGTVMHLAASSGRLAVTVQSGATGKVLLYDGLLSTSANRPPTVVLEQAELAGALKATFTDPQYSADAGRLLVLTPQRVVTFPAPFTAPATFTARDAGQAIDFLHAF
jgi:hypothetical protein